MNKSRFTYRPTTSGGILILVLFAMLLASMNYSNNMGYILCFLLVSLMLVSYLLTRSNIKGLEAINLQVQAAFAGEMISCSFDLNNRSSRNLTGIYCSGFNGICHGDFSGPINIPAGSCVTVKIILSAPQRGIFRLKRLTLFSIYPLGLFQARGELETDLIYLVYPKPEGTRQWPESETYEEESGEGFYSRGGDDFIGVRPYRPGESMHHIDWKAVARGRPLNIKEFTGGGSDQLWFSFSQLQGLDIEKRLSQLTRWILEADQEGREFGLGMPQRTLPLDCSPGHTVKCLETLATYGFER